MDYEKKYKDALELAKSYYGDGNMFLDTIFPELQESEDERIRKALIVYFKDYNSGIAINGISAKEFIAYLEKQKEQKPVESTALQKAFLSSKFDYLLEEKCDASDYADAILPTSIAYGENEEEYKLHKIIEAAFIAGQKKEQQTAEWSEEDKRKLNRIYEILGYAADDRGFLTSKRIIGDKEAIELQDFLKSLRPQPHWKPSEEQMKALYDIIPKSGQPCTLQSLHHELQQL